MIARDYEKTTRKLWSNSDKPCAKEAMEFIMANPINRSWWAAWVTWGAYTKGFEWQALSDIPECYKGEERARIEKELGIL
jgi:hypothetical protein